MDKSSGFPITGAKEDLATSTVPTRKTHTTEPPDHNETLAETHLTGSFEKAPGKLQVLPKGSTETGGPARSPVHQKVDPTQHNTKGGGHSQKWWENLHRRNHPKTGPTGKPGAPGAPGAAGKPGAPGAPGAAAAVTSSPELLFFGGNVPGAGEGEQKANQQTQATSSGSSPLVIVLILAAIGLAVYFYMQHDKKGGGGERRQGERREGGERKEEREKEEKS